MIAALPAVSPPELIVAEPEPIPEVAPPVPAVATPLFSTPSAAETDSFASTLRMDRSELAPPIAFSRRWEQESRPSRPLFWMCPPPQLRRRKRRTG